MLPDPYDERSARLLADAIMRMNGMRRRLQYDSVPEHLKKRVDEIIREKEGAK